MFSEEVLSTRQLAPASIFMNFFVLDFCRNCSDLFATCSKEDVRVWQTEKSQELLRITVKNKICTAIDFPQDGTMIITGKEHALFKDVVMCSERN